MDKEAGELTKKELEALTKGKRPRYLRWRLRKKTRRDLASSHHEPRAKVDPLT